MSYVVVAAWTAPFIFRYGGMSTFVENVLEEMLSRGYRVVAVSVSPTGFTGCRVARGVKVCNISTDPGIRGLDAVHHTLMEWCMSLAQGSEYVWANDYHMGFCAAGSGMAGAPTVFYMHAFAASPAEAAAAAYSRLIATNSKLMLSVLEPFLDTVYSMHGPWMEMTGRRPGARAVVYPAPPAQPERVDVEAAHRLLPEKIRGKRLIVAVSRPGANKAVELGAKAVSMLPSTEEAYYVTAGHGLGKGWLGKKWYSLGPVPEEVKWGLLALADAYLHPAVFEPFGLAPLEAVLAGTPAIVSDRTGVAEVLDAPVYRAGDPGSAAEALAQVLEDPEKTLSREEKSPIMKRTWSDVVSEIEKMLGV